MKPKALDLTKRLEAALRSEIAEQPDGCWSWTGRRHTGGYGQIKVFGRLVLAHRLAYEAWVGPIPDGFDVDHTCLNRLCINPAHLEAVTRQENVLRGRGPTAVNARKTHCLRGHPLSGSNLYVYNGRRQCKECQRQRDIKKRQVA